MWCVSVLYGPELAVSSVRKVCAGEMVIATSSGERQLGRLDCSFRLFWGLQVASPLHREDAQPSSKNEAPRGHKTYEEFALNSSDESMDVDTTVGGTRPGRLPAVWPQTRVQQRTVEQNIVLSTEVPALQMVEQLVEVHGKSVALDALCRGW